MRMSGTPNKPPAAATPVSPVSPQGAAGAPNVASPVSAAAVAVQELGQLLHHTAFNPDNTQRAAAERRLAEGTEPV